MKENYPSAETTANWLPDKRELFVSLKQLVTDLSFNDLAQCDILRTQALQRLHQRLGTTLELFHATGHHINQNVGVRNHFLRFFDVVVSQGRKELRLDDSVNAAA